MESIIELCRSLGRKKTEESYLSMEGDTLCIDCRNCMCVPEVKSAECIRCIVSAISECGNSERIRLRTGRDMEISGPSAAILCELAALDRSANVMNGFGRERGCANCEFSCRNVFNVAWQGFPDPFFEAARNKLMSFRAEDPECATCMQRTYRALDQAELGLNNVKKKVTMLAARGGK